MQTFKVYNNFSCLGKRVEIVQNPFKFAPASPLVARQIAQI